jgi:hypothetical protein
MKLPGEASARRQTVAGPENAGQAILADRAIKTYIEGLFGSLRDRKIHGHLADHRRSDTNQITKSDTFNGTKVALE